MIEDEKNRSLYWEGGKNKAIRYWYYNQKGLELFNQFKYLIAAIFGVYWTLKLDQPILLVVMFAVSVPFLSLAGWVQVHHVGKVVDFLSVQFSTHFGRYQITLLEEIRDELRNKKEDCGCH